MTLSGQGSVFFLGFQWTPCIGCEKNADKNKKGKEGTVEERKEGRKERKKRNHEKQIRKVSILKPPNPKNSKVMQVPITQVSDALFLSFEI